MGDDRTTFVYIGAYDTEADAQLDYDVVKELFAAGVIGTFDAAVITKDADGKVKVNKDEVPTRRGAWGGLGVGALLGLLFPPSLIASAAVGAVAGGVGAHLWKGLSRSDVKELGEVLDAGPGRPARDRRLAPGGADRQGLRARREAPPARDQGPAARRGGAGDRRPHVRQGVLTDQVAGAPARRIASPGASSRTSTSGASRAAWRAKSSAGRRR